MQAPYTPPEGQAACPHCGAATGPLVLQCPALVSTMLSLRCQDCQGQWEEVRRADGCTRFWEAAV